MIKRPNPNRTRDEKLTTETSALKGLYQYKYHTMLQIVTRLGREFSKRENLNWHPGISFDWFNPYEPQHDKTNKMTVRPAKTHISLGIRPVWSECSLSAWRNIGSLATHWTHTEDSDQTGQMPRLIWVFAGCTLTLLVLSCRGSYALYISNLSLLKGQLQRYFSLWNLNGLCCKEKNAENTSNYLK